MSPNILDNVDREPLPRKLDRRFGDKFSDLRNRPGERMKGSFPKFQQRNIGGGVLVGAVEAAILVIIEDTIGVPFGSDADVVGVDAVEETETGAVYTVNVNSPTQQIAEARAFIDSGTGFTTYLTDKLEVQNVEVLRTRTLRDTYQVDVLVED